MERVIISAAMTHMHNAKAEIEKLPRERIGKRSSGELDFMCRILDDTINHCQHVLRSTD